MSEAKKYKIKYRLEFGEFEPSDVDISCEGLTDALLFTSIAEEEDGGISTVWVTRDGNGPMSPTKQFLQWGILANELSQYEDLREDARNLCADTFEKIRQSILKQED